MNSNKFSMLNDDSDVEPEISPVEVKVSEVAAPQVHAQVQKTLFCQPALRLTSFDLVEQEVRNFSYEIKDGESPDEFNKRVLIQNCKRNLWSMMKAEYRQRDVMKTRVVTPEEYTRLLKKESRKFFRNLVSHIEGEWGGEITTVDSWYIGKSENGTPRYVYIGVSRGYGTCSFCDYYEGLRDELSSIYHEDKPGETIKVNVNKFARVMIGDTFKSLVFFTTWPEARKWVYQMNPYTEKRIQMPDFQKIKAEGHKLAEEKRIKESTALTDANFPILR